MDDHEFSLPVAIPTIAVAGLVLIWQRVRGWASALPDDRHTVARVPCPSTSPPG